VKVFLYVAVTNNNNNRHILSHHQVVTLEARTDIVMRLPSLFITGILLDFHSDALSSLPSKTLFNCVFPVYIRCFVQNFGKCIMAFIILRHHQLSE